MSRRRSESSRYVAERIAARRLLVEPAHQVEDGRRAGTIDASATSVSHDDPRLKLITTVLRGRQTARAESREGDTIRIDPGNLADVCERDPDLSVSQVGALSD